ncbi:MAG: DUF4233 domain-containing protein [Nesterenkonia sp.]
MAARRTRAQREWRPGQTRPPRSVKALFASTVLCLEAVLLLFLGLTAWGLNQNDWYAWWLLGGLCALAVVCLLACAVLHKPFGYPLGWVLQVVMVLSFVAVALLSEYGLGVLLALLPGAGFMACWWYAVTKGEQIDVEKMERYRAEEKLDEQAHGSESDNNTGSDNNGANNNEEQTP